MLKTRALRFSYDKNNHFSFPDINLSDGEELLILGKSGVGKTTFSTTNSWVAKTKQWIN